MITLKIDVLKIDKAHLFKGAKGTYLDLSLRDNKDGVDQYGNSGFIVQGANKEARERGEKGPIIGNWKDTEKKSDPNKWADRTKPLPKADAPSLQEEPEEDDIPF